MAPSSFLATSPLSSFYAPEDPLRLTSLSKLSNFSDFEVIDCGQTVRLGEYEAAADAILYECDSDYRRFLRTQRRESEKTFGACLRRLRLQRGLRLHDFGGVPARTIARIERGEVQKPHTVTLNQIAARLSVAPEEIETF